MKKYPFVIAIFTALSLLPLAPIEARDGGRGGGGGGRSGGASHHGREAREGGDRSRGGRTVQRSPSMSRTGLNHSERAPRTVPDRSNGSRPGGRPNVSPAPVERRPVGKPTTSSVKDFLNQHPGSGTNRPGTGQPNHGDRQNQGERQNHSERQSSRQNNRQTRGNQVREQNHSHREDRHDWFNDHYWDHHHHYPAYYHSHHNWWNWATPVALGAWLGWNATPIYYDNYIDNGVTYWGPSTVVVPSTTVVVPSTTYVQQPQQTNAPQEASDDWIPLGVFALTKEDSLVADPNIYLQLALNKNGDIAGSYYNATTDQGYEMEGSIDQNTQIVALQVVDDPNAPIMETGIYNLTQSEAPVRVHFIDGRIENMLLVRMDEPAP